MFGGVWGLGSIIFDIRIETTGRLKVRKPEEMGYAMRPALVKGGKLPDSVNHVFQETWML